MNKKALSAFLAMSSMAGVMAPSMTAFAAEENKNTVEDLITYAKNAKDLYHYNQAYAAIMADKDNANFNTWLGELAPAAKEIKGYDEMMKIIAEIQDEVQKNQSIEQYNAVVAKVQSLFDNGSICKTDKEYLDAELVYWTRTPIFTNQSDLTKVIDKTNEAAKLLADGKAKEAQTAIDAAKAILSNTNNNINAANEAYLTSNTVAPVAQNIEAAVSKLPVEVQSVEAINPMEIKITFDQPVDRDSAVNAKNYVFTINGNTYTSQDGLVQYKYKEKDKEVAITLIENKNQIKYNTDDNSVIFRLSTPLANGTKYTVDVKDGIYAINKDKKVQLTKGTEQQFNDLADPTLVSAKLTADYKDSNGDQAIELTFNEPVSSIGAVKADGITVFNNGSNMQNNSTDSSKPGNYTVVLKPDANLKNAYKNGKLVDSLLKEGTHNVVAYETVDKSMPVQNTANVLNTQYTVTKNSETPAVVSITPVNDNERQFDITFNKKVKFAGLENEIEIKKGDVKFDAQNGAPKFAVEARNADNDARSNDDYVKVVRVTIDGDKDKVYHLYKDDEKSVTLSVKVKNYSTAAGYIGEEYKGDVTLSKDVAGPKVEFNDCRIIKNGILIKFNKEVKDLNQSKIIVKDKNGISRTISAKLTKETGEDLDHGTTTSKYVTISLPGFADKEAYIDKAPYTVNILEGAVKSASSSEIIYNEQQQPITVDKENSVSPVVAGVDYNKTKVKSTVVNGEIVNEIIVKYKQKMNEESATNIANYTLDGKALPAGASVTLGENNTVTITLPAGSITETSVNLFEIQNVKTDDGSLVVANIGTGDNFTKILTLVNSTKPSIESAQFSVANLNSTKSNKIEVKFNQKLGAIDEADKASAIDDLKVTVNGTKQEITNVELSAVNSDTLYVTIDKEINISASQQTIVSIVPVGNDNAQMTIDDQSGNTVQANSSSQVEGKAVYSADEVNSQNQVNNVQSDIDNLIAGKGNKSVEAIIKEYNDLSAAEQNLIQNYSKVQEKLQAAIKAAIKAVQEADNADNLLTALQSKTLGLENVNEANKANYLDAKDVKDVKDVKISTVQEIQTNIVDEGNAFAQKAAVNAAVEKLKAVNNKVSVDTLLELNAEKVQAAVLAIANAGAEENNKVTAKATLAESQWSVELTNGSAKSKAINIEVLSKNTDIKAKDGLKL